MLESLTIYLFQHKQVVIPHIGSFEVQYQPATLNFTEKQIEPPQYQIVHYQECNVLDRQLQFLSICFNIDIDTAQRQLVALGEALRKKIESQSFNWIGVGKLNQTTDGISFLPANKLLAPVPAYKVIHENAQHNVRVGEENLQSVVAAERLQDHAIEKKSYLMLIVWTLIILSVLFIAYHLYRNGWQIKASGLQQKVTSLNLNLASTDRIVC